MIKFIFGLFKKKPEKIRIRVRDNKFMWATYPKPLEVNPFDRQMLACYEIQLNGNRHLGHMGIGSFGQ